MIETIFALVALVCFGKSVSHAVVVVRAASFADAHLEAYERMEGYIDPLEAGLSMLLGD